MSSISNIRGAHYIQVDRVRVLKPWALCFSYLSEHLFCLTPGYSREQFIPSSCALMEPRKIETRSTLKSLVRMNLSPMAWSDGTHTLLELKVLLGSFPRSQPQCGPWVQGPFKEIMFPSFSAPAPPPIISQLKKELAQNGIVQTQLWAPRTRDRGLSC